MERLRNTSYSNFKFGLLFKECLSRIVNCQLVLKLFGLVFVSSHSGTRETILVIVSLYTVVPETLYLKTAKSSAVHPTVYYRAFAFILKCSNHWRFCDCYYQKITNYAQYFSSITMHNQLQKVVVYTVFRHISKQAQKGIRPVVDF